MQEAISAHLKLTVDLTVKRLKIVEKVGISEKNKNGVLWLKRPVIAFQQGERGQFQAQK